MLNKDSPWLELVEDDFRWLFYQLEDATHLKNPTTHIEDWLAVAQHHRGYWRRLIRRASAHACQQRDREQSLIDFHAGILLQMQRQGFSYREDTEHQRWHTATRKHWGCMQCSLAFRSKGGEGAHMYKIHNQVNPVRTLFQGTQCPCCLKGYYTATKLKAHSLHADDCRRRLIGAQVHHPPDPGTWITTGFRTCKGT